MIKKAFFCVLFFVSACSITMESNQFNTIRAMFSETRHKALERQWIILYEGETHEAYAIQNKKDVTFLSLDHLEVDFEHTLITSIKTLSPYKEHIMFRYNQNDVAIYKDGVFIVALNCRELEQYNDYAYKQYCYNKSQTWSFTNELEVNENRDVVYIKTYYSIDAPPIELYFNKIFKK